MPCKEEEDDSQLIEQLSKVAPETVIVGGGLQRQGEYVHGAG